MKREKLRTESVSMVGGGISVLVMVVVLAGCSESARIIRLRQVDVTGPGHQIPVRVTDGDTENRLRITPNVAFMTKRNIDGNVEVEQDSRIANVSPYDTANNLHWNFPSHIVGISFDYGLSRHFSFSAGGNYSKTNQKESYEWDVGLAWCFYDKFLGGRIEAGLQWQDIAYNTLFDRYQIDYASSRIDAVRYLYTFDRYGDFRWGNLYANMTLNTRFSGSSLNGFVRVGYGVTSVLSNDMLRANEEGDIAATVGMMNITPGLFVNLNGWSRLVVGCEFLSPVSMTSYRPEWLLAPVAQVEFTL